ncbi:MAG: hypothetical protein R3261_06790, partial [Alphaproteobacteria bacterium]|nr:hypothetical protein [Alphaproteobacteria bacterium]
MGFGRRKTPTSSAEKNLISKVGDKFKDKRIVSLNDRQRSEQNIKAAEEVSNAKANVDQQAILETDEDVIITDVLKLLQKRNTAEDLISMQRSELSHLVYGELGETLLQYNRNLNPHEERDLVTAVLNLILNWARLETKKANIKPKLGESPILVKAREIVQPLLLEQMDLSKALQLGREELAQQVNEIVVEILSEKEINLNLLEQR